MCCFEHESREGEELRRWRLVAQVIGSLASWGFENHVVDLYWSSKGALEQVDTCKGCILIHARGVLWENTPKLPFTIETFEQRRF